MTQDETRHMNVILEDIRHKFDVIYEGHKLLDQKIDRKIDELKQELKTEIVYIKSDMVDIKKDINKMQGTLKEHHDLFSKLLELMDDHDKWLRDHDVRLKVVETKER